MCAFFVLRNKWYTILPYILIFVYASNLQLQNNGTYSMHWYWKLLKDCHRHIAALQEKFSFQHKHDPENNHSPYILPFYFVCSAALSFLHHIISTHV
jgi:hypothetical protein